MFDRFDYGEEFQLKRKLKRLQEFDEFSISELPELFDEEELLTEGMINDIVDLSMNQNKGSRQKAISQNPTQLR